MMDVLLTFTGFHDPYYKGLVGQEEQPGPILSLLSVRAFDRVYLFDTPGTQSVTSETKDAIFRLHPNTTVEVIQINLDDPTEYRQILDGLRTHVPEILADVRGADFYVAVASGTPQMHACWLLLVSGREVPAKILHVRPPRFVTKEKPIVTEVKFGPVESDQAPLFKKTRAEPLQEGDLQTDIASTAAQVGIIGEHPEMRSLLETAGTLAPSTVPILITGETGTGKELLSRFIHRLSGRPRELFVPVNCAAIPENLVESLLFGHKKGAFTGATKDQPGKFDAADDGTLFLDELGDLPLPVQAKLLRVLQDGNVEPVGAFGSHGVSGELPEHNARQKEEQPWHYSQSHQLSTGTLLKSLQVGNGTDRPARASVQPAIMHQNWGVLAVSQLRTNWSASFSGTRLNYAQHTRSTVAALYATSTVPAGTLRTIFPNTDAEVTLPKEHI